MESFIRNWHKPAKWYKTKPIECRGVIPRKLNNGGIELTITKEMGQQIQVTLNGEDAKLFLMNMDRFIYHLEVRREDYGLEA